MRINFGFLLVVLLPWTMNSLYAQQLKGKVVDEKGAPLAYVHIGFLNENKGTISKEDGRFEISLEAPDLEKALIFSSIGYETTTIPLQQREGNYLEVTLKKQNYALQPVTVEASKSLKAEKRGRFRNTKTTTGHSGISYYGLGSEWGLRIPYQGDRYQIKDINFHTRFNTLDSVLFRLNVYSLKEGLPDRSLLRKEIYVTSYKKDKWISKEVLDELLVIDQEIVVSFEVVRMWYRNNGGNHLFFSHGKGYQEGYTYSRESSFDAWKVDAKPPVALYISTVPY